MIMTVEELLNIVPLTNVPAAALQLKLEAIEQFICQFTHNDFISRIDGQQHFPADVKLGVAQVIEWGVKNNDTRGIASETISRHSVTYGDSKGENYINGYPAWLWGFLRPYMRARF